MAALSFSFFQRPLIAALTFHSISLFVGVASVPVLLIFLSDDDFLAWIIIATFGALTIQVEQGIQIVSVRRLARLWHAADEEQFFEELAIIQRSFRRFSLAVIFVLGATGFIYFGVLADLTMSQIWPLAWAAFILSYGLNYWFGYNSAILLASDCTAYFNLTNAFTRGVNFLLTVFLLWNGLSILGLALSFLASVSLSVMLLRKQAKIQMAKVAARDPLPIHTTSSDADKKKRRPTTLYTGYTVSNFFLYKGAFLVFPLFPGAHEIADYGLALQLVAIVYAISIIPTQVWLNRLVQAVLEHDIVRVRNNLLVSLGFGFTVFAVGFLAVVVIARPMLELIGSQVTLPTNQLIGLLFLGLMIEAAIFILINLLLILERTRVLWQYIFSVWIVLTVCCLTQLSHPAIGITTVFLLVPVLSQTFMTLPVAIWSVLRAATAHAHAR
jgi:hypothetical protein